MREKKLREVTNEYTKKYTTELNEASSSVELNFPTILNYIQGYYRKVDGEINLGG